MKIDKYKGDEKDVGDIIDDLEKDAMSKFQQLIKKFKKSSPTEQLAIGGVSGFATGYVSAKFGKTAATGLGVTILLLHLAHNQGYIQINWNKLNKDVAKAKKEIEKRANQKLPTLFERAKRIFMENVILAGGFTGGFFLGVATA